MRLYLWLSLVCTLLPGLGLAAATPGITGYWVGTLTVPGGTLHVVFHISKAGDDAYAATLDSPDQGAAGIPVDTVTLVDGTLTLVIDKIHGQFTGTIAADETKITGNWTQGGGTLPLTLARTEKLDTSKRPQEPKRPYPYQEIEVTFPNVAAGVTLAGTLTEPKTEGKFPAVVLITGSGPQDRDETVFNHKPFLIIADYLTRRGIAVLRVDDRGMGKSTGSLEKATTDDLVGDTLAAVNYLQTRADIDLTKIGLIGHSEGGMIAPLAATRAPEIAFIVLLAGPGIPGDRLLLTQNADMLRASGVDEANIFITVAIARELIARVKKDPTAPDLPQQLTDYLTAAIAKLPDEDRKSLGDNAAFIKTQVTALTSPWMRFFLNYDPAPALTRVVCPVLALNGDLDKQVSAKENLPAIQAALTAGGNRDATVKSLPGLNHLFQPCKTGAVNEYGKIETTFSPDALKIISDWMLLHIKK